jgi:hypothetical protein
MRPSLKLHVIIAAAAAVAAIAGSAVGAGAGWLRRKTG